MTKSQRGEGSHGIVTFRKGYVAKKERISRMNNIPTFEIQDGSAIDQLGKESGTLHKFLCAFRNAGGTIEDLRIMSDPGQVDLGRILARLRNIDTEDEWSIFMNLNAAPELPKDFGAAPIVDKRMGFWSVKLNGPDGLILGDRVIRIVSAQGYCVNAKGRFIRNELSIKGMQTRVQTFDLNAQAAKAICNKRDVAQSLFKELQRSEPDWLEQDIFFLGTVWKQRIPRGGGEGIYAKELHRASDGVVSMYDSQIPIGKWPKNCFIAVLEPYLPSK